MLDLVLIDGRARGILCRNLVTGDIERHAADAVILVDAVKDYVSLGEVSDVYRQVFGLYREPIIF